MDLFLLYYKPWEEGIACTQKKKILSLRFMESMFRWYGVGDPHNSPAMVAGKSLS